VTIGELTQWAELRRWWRRNRDALENWLGGVIILPFSVDVARTWGRISAAAIQRGRARPANDTWIAACPLTYGLPLATLNVKDFKDFAEHESLKLIVQCPGRSKTVKKGQRGKPDIDSERNDSITTKDAG
jgi:toxin FitB